MNKEMREPDLIMVVEEYTYKCWIDVSKIDISVPYMELDEQVRKHVVSTTIPEMEEDGRHIPLNQRIPYRMIALASNAWRIERTITIESLDINDIFGGTGNLWFTDYYLPDATTFNQMTGEIVNPPITVLSKGVISEFPYGSELYNFCPLYVLMYDYHFKI